MLNECNFIGYMGNDARVNKTENGRTVAQLSLGCTTRGYKKEDGTEIPDRTDWIPVVAWGGLAETIRLYTHKGSKLFVQGEWRNRSYEKDGIVRYISECYASKIILLDKKENAYTIPPDPQQPQKQSPVTPFTKGQHDELPF